MSSLVLARKYRPRSFGEMVGQEHVVRALANALGTQRLHHAYLFTGTRGVGKTTVARILAKSLNCIGADGQGGITAEPCGVCRACTEIDADRFIDYVEMDAASNRGIDEIRELLERAAYKPALGRFKVFMIDEVHQLTKDSFNALLKTLEEPPEYLKFVLATTDPEKVLPTVLSRCLQFNLRPMAPETVFGRLRQVLDAEGVPAERAALQLLARAARGSMRDALSLTDQAIAFGAGALEEAGVRQMLGSVDRSHVFALLEALADGDGARLVAGVDALRTEGLSAEGALEEMATLLQQMAVVQAVPDALDADDPQRERTAALAARLPADETQLLYSIALHGRAELGLAPDEYSGLVMVLLRMLAFRPKRPARQTPEPSATRGAHGESQAAALPVPQAASARPLVRPAASASVSVAPTTTPRPRPVAARAEGPEAVSAPSTVAPLPVSPAAAGGPSTGPREGGPREGGPKNAGSQTAVPRTAASDTAGSQRRPPWEDESDSLPELPPWVREADEAIGAAHGEVLGEGAGEGGVEAAHAGLDEAPAAVPPVQTGPLGDRWAALVSALVEKNAVGALVRELALQSQCTAIDEGERRIALRVERESLRHPAHAEKLQAALALELGHAVRIEVEPGEVVDTPARREAGERVRRQREAEALLQNDPLVLQLTAQFKTARLVPGSIKAR